MFVRVIISSVCREWKTHVPFSTAVSIEIIPALFIFLTAFYLLFYLSHSFTRCVRPLAAHTVFIFNTCIYKYAPWKRVKIVRYCHFGIEGKKYKVRKHLSVLYYCFCFHFRSNSHRAQNNFNCIKIASIKVNLLTRWMEMRKKN